ncbi:hypothetical protein HN51_017442 [Arachis hypogaea]|nr:uncharacterized protein DS421_16g565700 [Arachis hypogaea]
MKNQIMSTSLIVLFIILSFASNGGLLAEAKVTVCRSEIPMIQCIPTECEKVCDHDYSSNKGRAKGICLDRTRCICIYPPFNGRCF